MKRTRQPYGTQTQIHFTRAAWKRLQPDAETLREIESRWLTTGKAPRGVTVTPTVWGRRLGKAQLREMLAGGSDHFGIVTHYHRAGQTLCDYDDPATPPTFKAIWELAKTLDVFPRVIEVDRTAHGWHMAIRWDRHFDIGQTIALQCLLGSDPKRESFNLLRALSGDAESNPRWNVLFGAKLLRF